MTRAAKSIKTNITNTGNNSKLGMGGNAAFDVLASHIRARNNYTNNQANSKRGTNKYDSFDESDLEIIRYMLAGYTGADIARKTGMPLTTIQRRSKRLLQEGFVIPVTHLNYKKFGLRRGMLFLKCKNADLEEAVKYISKIKGIESAGAYLGSLNLIANVVYVDIKEVLQIVHAIQKLDLINEVTWLEEVYSLPV
jgi:DNA-binding Lrp family transcriptional regulator